MIVHITPLYAIAMILSVLLILVILAGLVMIDWRQIFHGDEEEFDPSWMDEEKWRK